MLVKEVIMLAAANLGREDLVQSASALTHPMGELASLLRCYNLVENEIALEYLPLKREDVVHTQTCRLSFLSLSYAPVELISVKDDGGNDLPYTCYPDGIVLNRACVAHVYYSYSPAEKKWSDEGSFSGKVSARLLALGVTCEFCLSRGQFSEAAVWQKRYQEALRAAAFRRRKRVMRSRRWI